MNPASALPHVPEVSEAPPSLYALLKEDIDSVMSRDPAARSRSRVFSGVRFVRKSVIRSPSWFAAVRRFSNA